MFTKLRVHSRQVIGLFQLCLSFSLGILSATLVWPYLSEDGSYPLPEAAVSEALQAPCNIHRQKTSYEDHYDEKYFLWQVRQNEFVGNATSADYRGLVQPEDIVVDFGCSSGAVLNAIHARDKHCVELNKHARKWAEDKYKLKTYARPEQLKDEVATFVYTTQVLEHVEAPIVELRILYQKLKPGGRLFVEVMNDGYNILQKWDAPDINNHIYTWNELLLHNLVKGAGFKTQWVESMVAAWPNNYEELIKTLSPEEFDKACKEEGERRKTMTLRLLAVKEGT